MAGTHFIAEPGVPQVVIAREFDAPRELLFRAHIDPDLLVQWFAPRQEDRDLDLQSAMQASVSDSMDRLGELLARLAPVGR